MKPTASSDRYLSRRDRLQGTVHRYNEGQPDIIGESAINYRWLDEPAVPLPEGVGFTESEHWAWRHLAFGNPADMSLAPGGDKVLSRRFLETVLFMDPWRQSIARPVARIIGATFDELLDFESRFFDGKLEFVACVFEQPVILTGLELRRSLNLRGCHFHNEVNADRIRVGGLLVAEQCVFAGNVMMDDVSVATDIRVSDTVFEQLWSIDDAEIGGNLFLGPAAHFKGRLEARRASVGKSIDLSGSRFEREVALVGAEVGTELLLDSVMKPRPRGFGRGEDAIPPNFKPKPAPAWGENAKLNLRNTHVRILQSSLNAWRQPNGRFVARDLTGFTFDRLGGGENRVESLHRESKAALVGWLEENLVRTERALPNGGYSPARYRALAKTLRETGHEAKARYVLWALGRARKRSLPTFSFAKIVETLSGQITGYGYQQIRGLIYSGVLVMSFAAIGMFWPHEAATGRDWTSLQDWTAWLGFSFEKAVPFSDLDPIQDDFLIDKFGEIPRGMRAAYMAERVVGIIILGFVIAGFTGWAERRGQ